MQRHNSCTPIYLAFVFDIALMLLFDGNLVVLAFKHYHINRTCFMTKESLRCSYCTARSLTASRIPSHSFALFILITTFLHFHSFHESRALCMHSNLRLIFLSDFLLLCLTSSNVHQSKLLLDMYMKSLSTHKLRH